MDVHSQADGGWKVTVVTSVLILMLTLMVVGRIVSRSLKKSKLQKDDYMLLLATLLTFALCAIGIAFPRIAGVAANVGKTLPEGPFDSISARKAYFVWTLLYNFSIAATKWSILLLYLRVFTTSNRWFTVLLWGMGILITTTVIASTFTTIFQCTPTSYSWRNPAPQSACIDVVAFNKFTSVPNIVSGVVMILMPLPPVFKLNISTLQKIGLSATFLHGIIGVLASIARLISLSGPDNQPIPQTIWTINEPTNYIIAACLPTLRPLFMRIFPESFFVLSKPRSRSSKPYTSTLKISWSKGSIIPIRFGVEKDRFANPRKGDGRFAYDGVVGLGGMGGSGGLESPQRSRNWGEGGGVWDGSVGFSEGGVMQGSRGSSSEGKGGEMEIREESVVSLEHGQPMQHLGV